MQQTIITKQQISYLSLQCIAFGVCMAHLADVTLEQEN